jgi:HSP20 family molecular chaperone IbpA
MRCENCGAEMRDEWEYCPKCGHRNRGRKERRSTLDSVFSRFRKEFEEMDRMFERDFEAFDISPFFGRPKSSGFTVKIVSSNKQPPKVTIKTYGDVDEKKLEKQIKNQLGVGGFERAEEPRPARAEKPREPLRVPKVTEEPKTEIRRVGTKVMVDMEIPGVEREDDVEIRELENSVEVKALSKDKAFFKILTKPGQSRLSGKRFEKGKLRLEFS